MSEIKQVAVRVPADIHRELRIACFEDGKSMQDVIIGAVKIHLLARKLHKDKAAREQDSSPAPEVTDEQR